MRHTLPGHRFKVVHRNSESDDLKMGGGNYVWIWTDRYPGNYLSGRLARTRVVASKIASLMEVSNLKTAGLGARHLSDA